MKIKRTFETSHPLIISCSERIESIIKEHKIPIRLFETGRNHERHQMLIRKGKTKDIISSHLYKLDNEPPLYSTALDYVFYDGKWSWNFRDSTILAWYQLFGNLVLDACPELSWGGFINRKSVNYSHFILRRTVIMDNLEQIPCVVP
jgi:hypothetical protein